MYPGYTSQSSINGPRDIDDSFGIGYKLKVNILYQFEWNGVFIWNIFSLRIWNNFSLEIWSNFSLGIWDMGKIKDRFFFNEWEGWILIFRYNWYNWLINFCRELSLVSILIWMDIYWWKNQKFIRLFTQKQRINSINSESIF